MRLLFLIILLANLVVYAFGAGWLGTAPAERGRESASLHQELNANAVVLKPPGKLPASWKKAPAVVPAPAVTSSQETLSPAPSTHHSAVTANPSFNPAATTTVPTLP